MGGRGFSRQERIRRQREAGFKGRRNELAVFRNNLTAGTDSDAFVFAFHVHGNGGVGKSSLVRQWEQQARRDGAVTAYVDEGVHSAVEAMEAVAAGLRRQGVELKAFDKLLTRYRQRQHEAAGALAGQLVAGADGPPDPDAPPAPPAPPALSAPSAAPAPSGAAVTLTRLALAGASLVPGVAPFAGAVDATRAAQAMERARSMLSAQFRSHEDVRLVLAPESVLTPVLVEDLTAVAAQHPFVLLTFDTWEQTGPVLDTWLRDLVLNAAYGELPVNVVTVTAGRQRLGPGWRDSAEQIGLDVFTDDEARQLLAHMDITDEPLVAKILEVSRRLPVLVAMLAQRGATGPGSVDDPADTAVELFLKWETDPARRTAALLCALPLHLNEDVYLAAVPDPPADGYAWLRGLAFVTEQDGRLRYHDIVRRTMLRLQRARSPQRWSTDHERLAAAFRRWREAHEAGLPEQGRWRDADWQDTLLNETYHALCAHPRLALPGAVASLAHACGRGLPVLRRWVQMLDDAAGATEHSALTHLADRLLAATTTDAPDAVPALTALLAVPGTSPETRALAHSVRGTAHRDADRFDPALADYNAALALVPDLRRAFAGRGETHRRAGRQDDALADLDRAVAIGPDDAWTLGSRAAVHHAQGRHEDAVADYSRAFALQPDYAFAVAGRGSVYRSLGRYDEAFADYATALELLPRYTWAIAERARTYQAMDRHEEAVAEFGRATGINPAYDWAFAQRSLSHRALGDDAAALADLDEAIRLDPDYVWALTQRGRLHQDMELHEEAVADFDRAIEINPDYARALAQRSVSHQALGNDDAALADLDEAIRLDPDYVWALTQRGRLHQDSDRHEAALADFDHANEIDPGYTWALARRSVSHRALGADDAALADLDEALRLDPEYTWALLQRGILLGILDRYDDALADLDRAVALEPDGAVMLARRGSHLRILGRHAEASADLDRAVALQPDYAYAWAWRAENHRLTGNLTQALADFDRAITLEPDSATTWARRGSLLGNLGRHDEASADLDRAVALQPDYADAWAWRGDNHRLTGNLTQALTDFDRAIELRPDDSWVLTGRAETLLALDRWEDALAALDQCVGRAPADPWSRHLTALALRRLGREGADEQWHAALEVYQAVAEAGPPKSMAATANIVVVLAAQGDWSAAETQATTLTALAPPPDVLSDLRHDLDQLAHVLSPDPALLSRLRARLT